MLFLAALHPLTPGGSWLSGSIHPSTIIGIAALAGLYVWRARAAPERPTTGQIVAFSLGLLLLLLSLNGPLHDLSDSYLFSAHMVQHMLLTMIITPLLIIGTPGWMLRPALRVPAIAAVARAITRPAVTFFIFSATIVVWHLPPMYNTAMAIHPIHIVQHLCFLVASTLMWWPVLSPMPELPPLSYPKQMLYMVLVSMPMSLVSILITYSDSVMYPVYAAAPRVTSLTPLQDQLVGGLIMWIPGGLIFVAAITVIFFRWVGEHDREEMADRLARTAPHAA